MWIKISFGKISLNFRKHFVFLLPSHHDYFFLKCKTSIHLNQIIFKYKIKSACRSKYMGVYEYIEYMGVAFSIV